MSDDLERLVLLANIAATFVMVGLIWFVQVVHYPLFDLLGEERFVAYEAAHVRATGQVVGLPMLVELITAGLLAWQPPMPELGLACRIGLGLVAAIWVSTACLQVPCHDALGHSFGPAVHRRLVRTNWIRTVAWSLRGALMLYVLERMLAAARHSLG